MHQEQDADEGFGDDFDDFEEGDEDAEFGDFDNGFQEAESTIPQIHPNHPIPPAFVSRWLQLKATVANANTPSCSAF